MFGEAVPIQFFTREQAAHTHVVAHPKGERAGCACTTDPFIGSLPFEPLGLVVFRTPSLR